MLVASLVICPLYLYEKRACSQESTNSGIRLVSRVGWLRFSLLSVLGIMPPSILLAWGLDRSLAVNGSVLSLLIPIQMALLAGILLGERMTWVRWVSFWLAIAGVLVISDFDWHTLGIFRGKYLFGNSLIFIAGLGSSFYNTYAKNLLARYTPLQVVLYGYVLTLLFTTPLLVWLEPAGLTGFLTFGRSTWVAIGVLGLFSWGLGVTLFFRLLVKFEVTQLSVAIYLLPVFGVLISAVTLKEKITLPMVTGGLLVLIGTYLVTACERPPGASAPFAPVADRTLQDPDGSGPDAHGGKACR